MPDSRADLRHVPGRLLRTIADEAASRRTLRQLRVLSHPEHASLVADLRARFAALERERSGQVESPWWTSVRDRLARHVHNDDPRAFLTWDEIRETMFVSGREPYVAVEHRALRAAPDWGSRWRPALQEDSMGCPARWSGDRSTSPNLIHHAFHLMRFEQIAGSIANLEQVVEFGGGYGSVARLARRLGFAGAYHIHDFPEFGALQRYFLAGVELERTGTQSATQSFGTKVADVPARSGSRVFVALWSLSETPLAVREDWLAVATECSHVFVAFQHEFEGVDNHVWFAAMRDRIDLDWHVEDLAHVPGRHSYAIGLPKR
jgi:hypothetical protein